jgi:flagellar hook-associated protein 2
MGKELTDLDDRIKTLTKRLTSMEESYYTKFNAMEQAINKLNSQSSSITNLLSQ